LTDSFPGQIPASKDRLKEVTVASKLLFTAVAYQRHWSSSSQFVQETKRELLAVIPDRPIPAIDRPAFEQLVAIPLAERRPRDLP
jgi:hypothetical protein